MSCVDSKICPACKIEIQCGGPHGELNKEKTIVYTGGPCICALHVCPACNHDWMPMLTNMKYIPYGDIFVSPEAMKDIMFWNLEPEYII